MLNLGREVAVGARAVDTLAQHVDRAVEDQRVGAQTALGQLAQDLAGGGVDDADVEVLDEEQDVGSGVGSADSDVVQASVVAQGEAPQVLRRSYTGCGSRVRAA